MNSSRYVTLDRSATQQNTEPCEVIEAQRHVAFLLSRMEYAIAHHQFEKARFYSSEEYREREKLRLLKEQHGINEAT